MPTTRPEPDRLLAFRRRAVSVTAAVLAVGMPLLAVVLETTNPVIVAVDVVLLVSAGAVHAAAALTVGRRWEPGGVVCLAYLVVITLLIGVSFLHADTPQSDSFWFLLIPVGLSGVTMSGRLHATVIAFGLTTYVMMTSLGPGLDPPLTASRLVSMALFGLAAHAIAGRLAQALVDADEAQAALAGQLDEVHRLNGRLTELDRAKDDFVSTVSHELRTPLTVIQGLGGMLDTRWDDLGDDRRRDVARRLGANARALQGIVTTLLDLARIERGGLDPVAEPVRLRGAVEESLLRLEPLLQEHVVSVDVAEPVVVSTDPRLLERVLDNLLTNAARHTSAGTPVRVRARPEGSAVRVEVADDGPGVRPEELDRLTDQFYRAGQASSSAAAESVGLGLALVHDVLVALGSRLEVGSQAGRGMTFSFLLPAVAADGDRPVSAVSGQSGAERA